MLLLKFILSITIICSIYLMGWNNGYDVGQTSKDNDTIIRGNITCKRLK